MRFPWLQVDTDFIDSKASELGALLGVSRREAAGLALDLWKWVLARSPADRPPDGILTGSAPVPVLASAVSWPDPDRLVSALVEVGLVERIADGLRIRGIGRYKTTWEKNRRKPDRNRTGTDARPDAEPDRKTQTQTQKETGSLVGSADAAPQAGLFAPETTKAAKQRHSPDPEPKPDQRHSPLMRAMEVVYSEVLPGEKWDLTKASAGREAKAVKGLLAKADADPRTAGDAAQAEVIRRWRHALADQYSRVRYAHLLLDRWGQYATPRGAGAAKPADTRAPVRAESQPQYDPSKPAVTVLKGADAFKEWCP